VRVCDVPFQRSRAAVVHALAAPSAASAGEAPETQTLPKRQKVAVDGGAVEEGRGTPVLDGGAASPGVAAKKTPRVWPSRALPATAMPLALHWHRCAATPPAGKAGKDSGVEVTVGATGLKQGMAAKDRPKAGSRICRAKQFARYAALVAKGAQRGVAADSAGVVVR
jgi:hypothetical protein